MSQVLFMCSRHYFVKERTFMRDAAYLTMHNTDFLYHDRMSHYMSYGQQWCQIKSDWAEALGRESDRGILAVEYLSSYLI